MFFTPSQKSSIQDYIEREIVLLTEEGDPRVLSELTFAVLENSDDYEDDNNSSSSSGHQRSYGRKKVMDELSPFITRASDLDHFINGLFRYMETITGNSRNRPPPPPSTASSVSPFDTGRYHPDDEKDAQRGTDTDTSKSHLPSSDSSSFPYVHHSSSSRTRSRSRSRERSYSNLPSSSSSSNHDRDHHHHNNNNGNNYHNRDYPQQQGSRDRYDRYPRGNGGNNLNYDRDHQSRYPGHPPPPPYAQSSSSGMLGNRPPPPPHGWQPPPFPGPGRPPFPGPPHPHPAARDNMSPPYPPPPAYLHQPPPPRGPSSASSSTTLPTPSASAWGSAGIITNTEGVSSSSSSSNHDYSAKGGYGPPGISTTTSASSSTTGSTKALRTIRVNNLFGDNASIVSLSSYFSKFGQVVNVILTEHNQAYVQFKESYSADQAVQNREPVYGDRRIQVTMAKYDPSSSSSGPSGHKGNPHGPMGTKSEYVGGPGSYHGRPDASSQSSRFPSTTANTTSTATVTSTAAKARPSTKSTEVIEPVVPIVIETAVDKAQRVLEEKLKTKTEIQEAIKEQKQRIEQLKQERSKLTPDEIQKRKEIIMKEAARIKEQQEKLETAIRIAKIAVDNQANKLTERATVNESVDHRNSSNETDAQSSTTLVSTGPEQTTENTNTASESVTYIPDDEIVIEGNDDDDNVHVVV